MMRRKLLGFCAFLVYGTFGMLSGVAQANHNERVAPSETITLQGDGLQRQEMSDEEKQRRREECDRMHDYCYEWCDKTNGGSPCKTECDRKYEACLKAVPSNPKKDYDY